MCSFPYTEKTGYSNLSSGVSTIGQDSTSVNLNIWVIEFTLQKCKADYPHIEVILFIPRVSICIITSHLKKITNHFNLKKKKILDHSNSQRPLRRVTEHQNKNIACRGLTSFFSGYKGASLIRINVKNAGKQRG